MHIRSATEADYPRLVAILNQTSVREISLEDFATDVTHSALSGPVGLLLLERESEIVGYGMLSRSAWLPPNGIYIGLRVEPKHSNQGVGSELLNALEEQALAWGYTMVEVGVRDHRPDWLAFAQGRGYVMKEHFFSSELELATFDPEPFRHFVTDAEARGYSFMTLADFPAHEGQRLLYEIDIECSRDEPDKGPDWQPMDFEAYKTDMFSPEKYDPKAIYVAMKDGEWAGVSGCEFPPGRPSAWVFFTGVRRAYRRQGLAQALKLLACEYVRRRGDYPKIATSNHASNRPMLAINERFGFVPMPGSYILRRSLV